MICAEEVPFVTLQDVERGAADVRSEVVEGMQVSGSAFGVDPSGSREDLEGVQTYCEAWGVERSDPVEDEPVVSDLPALILSGQYDPGTPPENGLVTAETLSNSYFVEVPNAGHGEVFSYPLCVLPIVADFLDEPAVEPNTSCIAGVPPVEWALP
jgi:pimeloyl-ACP methyl ester carboxylesterase